ncbi:MAG: hypothetical protein WDW38_006217 [Sanguina aurantia]
MATMKMNMLNKSALPTRCTIARPTRSSQRTRVVAAAIDDTNIFINLLASSACMTIPAAVTIATSEFRDAEIEKVQTLDGALPLIAAASVDAICHSIPGINLLFGLVAEPVGAACGVAYMMSILLSSAAIDPATLAPKGTVLNAQKSANPVTAAVRVPFTSIIPTTLKVRHGEQDVGGLGALQTEEQLEMFVVRSLTRPSTRATAEPPGRSLTASPQLPLNSVLVIVGVGCLILEAASHAPVLTFFMPRVLSVAGSLAAVGWALESTKTKTTA